MWSKLAIFLLIAVLVSAPFVGGQVNATPQQISVTEIGKSVTLIGRLGKPLGQKFTVRGRWSIPVSKEEGTALKVTSPYFTVTEIDGKKFDDHVAFDIAQIRPVTYRRKNPLPEHSEWASLDGQTWTMAVYETGYIGLYPNDSRDATPVFPTVAHPYYTRPFTSQLVVVVTSQEPASEGKPE